MKKVVYVVCRLEGTKAKETNFLDQNPNVRNDAVWSVNVAMISSFKIGGN